MPYSTIQDVRAIVDTNITDANITSLIADTDAYMDSLLDTGSLNNILKRMLSRTYTAYVCMRKDPTARSIGQYSESRAVSLQLLPEDIAELFSTSGTGGVSLIAASESLG